MINLESYTGSHWRSGAGAGRSLVNPVTGEIVAQADSGGVDMAAALASARASGGQLRAMSFAERGVVLGAIADVLIANRAAYADIARINSGNTARDAAIDIDGGIGTLKYYARLGKSLGNGRTLIEAGEDQLTKSEAFKARHVWTSRHGVAVCINAFNFPSWGLWEKVATALLAGLPVLAKPATATAWLSERMVRDVVAAGVAPQGVLSIVCGSAEGLLAAVSPFDGVIFTGSADTGRTIRGHASVLAAHPRIAIEADSINAAVLGESAMKDGAVFGLLVREATAALNTKAGQLCTNIRRIFVPAALSNAFAEALGASAGKIVTGDPAQEGVTMGPLVNEAQRQAALAGIAQLSPEARTICGGGAPAAARGADAERGAFVAPTVLLAETSGSLSAVHDVEVFGPALTIIPYESRTEAVALVNRGGGSLAASVWCEDSREAAAIATGVAPLHGRVLCVDPEVGSGHSGHSIVMPQCVHGGPGRAGGGEELGGLRGLRFHMQRTAVQGSSGLFEALGADVAKAQL